MWKLHSWSTGLDNFEYDRNEENSSESVNAYYPAALIGLAYGDTELASVASTLTAFEIRAAQTWRHVKEQDTLYSDKFTRYSRVVGNLWASTRKSSSFYQRAESLSKQVLPITPVSEVLFPDLAFVRQLVNWAWPSFANLHVDEGWKGFVYALQGMYDGEGLWVM